MACSSYGAHCWLHEPQQLTQSLMGWKDHGSLARVHLKSAHPAGEALRCFCQLRWLTTGLEKLEASEKIDRRSAQITL